MLLLFPCFVNDVRGKLEFFSFTAIVTFCIGRLDFCLNFIVPASMVSFFFFTLCLCVSMLKYPVPAKDRCSLSSVGTKDHANVLRRVYVNLVCMTVITLTYSQMHFCNLYFN